MVHSNGRRPRRVRPESEVLLMKKTPDKTSKLRQSLSLQRDIWLDKAKDLELTLAEHPADRTCLVRQIEYALDEADKLSQALVELSTLTRRQKLAGWGETRKRK